jgi:thermitase
MAIKKLDHPAFGPCELIPTLVAVKWKAPLPPKDATLTLSAYSLKLATQTPKVSPARRGARDPRSVNINHSERLSWATGTKLTDSTLNKVRSDDNVDWVGPVYRATGAEPGPQSYFAINPTILLLSQEAAAAIGDFTSLDPSASIDQNRTKLIKAFVVVNFPNGNAIEVANKIRKNLATQAVADGVRFENTPYLSPTCSNGCGCSEPASLAPVLGKCAPSTTPVIPNDTFFPSQWGLQRVNAPAAWPLTEGDPNVVIAVLDQGVELLHPDLNMWPISYSTITHTNDGSPVGNHGTACAGIIGGKIDNGLGVAGLAGNCRVMAIATNFADTEVVEGLNYAADNGARVVSMSFGVYPSWMVWDFTIIETALQYCQDKNLVLVAASGNENQAVARFPGSDPRTICVGGSNRDDVRKSIGDTSIENWWGACYGPDLDVVAPCLEIYTSDRLGALGYTPTDYDPRFNGTSSATPHVAALAGLIISFNPALTSTDVRKIISETCDKIGMGTYTYLAAAGKPFGTWNSEVGYGRINAERALLVACESGRMGEDSGPCAVKLPRPEPCCVSPCDPPWRPDANCMFWYEVKFFRVALGEREGRIQTVARALATGRYIEFRITYLHKWCLLGKQHGPLLYTITLLPGEKATLYHSERYRRITSVQERYSVQTTFMQFLSVVHEARVTDTLQILSDRLASAKTAGSVSVGGGLAGVLGLPSGSASTETSVTDHNMLQVGFVSDQFNQSLVQSSQLTHAERSLVISTYQEKDSLDISVRRLFNANECRAVTYFVRRIVELYAFSTTVSDISYRIIAPNIPPDWHTINDLGRLPQLIQNEIKAVLKLLPKVGDVIEKPQPISIPTDGAVYDPELANCCSCEPQREAAIKIKLEKQKAEALKACLDAQELELELERRRMLLQKGDLSSFEAAPALPQLSG